MAWFFGDGFDLYNAIADTTTHWDGPILNGTQISATGRFAGSRSIITNYTLSTNPSIIKTSGVNDAIHHITLAYTTDTITPGNTGPGLFFTLYDGATAQCTIQFQQDGGINLARGAAGGTVVATYVGATTAINNWHAFEIEVVINNTTGSFAVRKNGNTVNDFFLGSLNTRAGANNYANKLGLSAYQNFVQKFDDFLWRSDAASVAWLGDIRCYTRMPLIDTQRQWSQTGTRSVAIGGSNPFTYSLDTVLFSPYTCPNFDGAVTAWTFTTSTGTFGPGTYKCAIYSDNGLGAGASTGAAPLTLLGTATGNVTNPFANSSFTFTFGTPVPVTANQKIWVAIHIGGTITGNSGIGNAGTGWRQTLTSAAFPQTPLTGLTTSGTTYNWPGTLFVTPTHNATLVNEVPQDAATTYAYAAANGLADFYSVNPITNSPIATFGVVTRGLFTKSDAGTRNAAVQVKSGGTTVQGTPVVLSSSSWAWIARIDLVDPATGEAWTSAAVNNLNIGPIVTT